MIYRFEKIQHYFNGKPETQPELSTTDLLYIINSVDFKVYKDDGGYLRLKDLQNGNLNNIEDESFTTIDEISDRLWESYVSDYWIEI